MLQQIELNSRRVPPPRSSQGSLWGAATRSYHFFNLRSQDCATCIATHAMCVATHAVAAWGFPHDLSCVPWFTHVLSCVWEQAQHNPPCFWHTEPVLKRLLRRLLCVSRHVPSLSHPHWGGCTACVCVRLVSRCQL